VLYKMWILFIPDVIVLDVYNKLTELVVY